MPLFVFILPIQESTNVFMFINPPMSKPFFRLPYRRTGWWGRGVRLVVLLVVFSLIFKLCSSVCDQAYSMRSESEERWKEDCYANEWIKAKRLDRVSPQSLLVFSLIRTPRLSYSHCNLHRVDPRHLNALERLFVTLIKFLLASLFSFLRLQCSHEGLPLGWDESSRMVWWNGKVDGTLSWQGVEAGQLQGICNFDSVNSSWYEQLRTVPPLFISG